MDTSQPPAGGDDDVPHDELLLLPIATPHDFDLRAGYDGRQRYLGVWCGIGHEITISDGYITMDGNSRWFSRWDNKAGRKYLKAVAERSDEYTPSDVPEIPMPLTNTLADSGYDLGQLNTEGNAALLYDSLENVLYVGGRGHVRDFLTRFNDAPEWLQELPDGEADLDALADEDNDSDDRLFGDGSGDR